MSNTTTDPQGGAAPAAEPAATETEATAPADAGAATETTETEQPKPSRVDRRIAALSARLSAGEQERARLAAELERTRTQAPRQPSPVTPEDIPRLVEQQVAERLERDRADRFHEAGRASYPDWQDKCAALMQMGADAQIAQLLIETPDGPAVAAALADDPEEMERIAGLRTERARAIALGRFAASMEKKAPAGAPAAGARRTTQAPPPIRPIGGGTARAAFNEATATTQQLVEYYAKQAAERRNAR
jgi:hypothetical protein